MKSTWTRTLALGALAVLLVALPAAAQEVAPQPPINENPAHLPPHQSVEALAKASQNPVSSLISVPFQGNIDFGIADRDATASTLNFQPVMPFKATKDTNVIFRVIMPLTSRPGPTDAIRFSGVGDVTVMAFFTPAKAHAVTWGAGPAFILPSATNAALGAEKFGLGVAFVTLAQPGHWTVGLLFNQYWSTSGANDRPDFNITFLQPFINYNLGNGVSVGYSMEASANWKADSDHTWNAPMVFKIAKVTLLGHQHVQLEAGAGPVVASSDAAATWRFRTTVTFLFPR